VEKPTATTLDVIANQEGRKKPIDPRDKLKRHGKPDKPISQELTEKQGSKVFRVSQDSDASICIRASMAGSNNVMRFGLRFEELGEEEVKKDSHAGEAPLGDVDRHLSFMENQLERLESQMHAMLQEADLSKERDSIYHLQTDAMHKATLFWPIVHVGILLVTGFTQANHIVQFFKKRHLI
jgi:hypothetical protein